MTSEEERKQFYRAMVSANDFDEARSYIEAINENTSDVLRYAAVLAALIAYCRPFIKSNPGKGEKSDIRITLNPEDVLSQSEEEFHKKLIEWRGNAIAHSSFYYRPAKVIRESDTSYSFISVPSSHYLDQIDPKDLAQMAEKFRQAALIKAFELKQKIGDIGV